MSGLLKLKGEVYQNCVGCCMTYIRQWMMVDEGTQCGKIEGTMDEEDEVDD